MRTIIRNGKEIPIQPYLTEPRRRPTKAAAKLSTVRPPCIYLGPIVQHCPHGWEMNHVYACDFEGHDHDRCTRGRNNGKVASCETCDHHQTAKPSPPGEFTRHLIYHIYPVSGNGAWQRNVGRLVERLRIINGKRIVTIVVDPPTGRKPDPDGPRSPDRGRQIHGCDSPEAVMEAFQGHDVEFIIAENDPQLREAGTLIPMLERLPRGETDVTLYAQAKATTRSPAHIGNHWSDLQYIIYFDYWLLVAEQLKKYPVTGAFKKLGAGWSPDQSKSDWHYSGSWFWFRNADLFSRDWRTIDRFWSGIEPYPSQHFYASEAGSLFLEGKVPELNLYRKAYWKRSVNPAFRQWRNDMKPFETPF